MTSIEDALKEIRAAYKSTLVEDDYIIVMKNNDTYEMNSRATDPNGLNVFAGNITEYQGVPEGVRINKRDLPGKIKKAIKNRVEMEVVSQFSGKDFHDLGYKMSYKGEFSFENETGFKWEKQEVITLDGIDAYTFATTSFPEWKKPVGDKIRIASRHENEDIEEEIYTDYLWEWVNGFSTGIKEQLENKGFIIEED